MGLDVTVTDSLGVDVGQGAEQLVGVELDLENRHGRLHLVEVPRRTVDGLGNELLDQVQVDLIFLREEGSASGTAAKNKIVGELTLSPFE